MISEESNSEKSVSYQKKDGRGHGRPSFFWYDNDKDSVQRDRCAGVGNLLLSGHELDAPSQRPYKV